MGTDPVFGRGALDIQGAFQPLGALKIPTPAGSVLIESLSSQTAMTGGAFGDAFQRTGVKLSTVLYDEYDRRFTVGLGDLFRDQGRRSAAPVRPMLERSSANVTAPGGGGLGFTVEQDPAARSMARLSGLSNLNVPESVAISYSKAGMTLDFWTGKSGATPMFGDAPVDDFSSLVRSQAVGRVLWRSGRWVLSAEQGSGGFQPGPVQNFAPVPVGRDPSAYGRMTASALGRTWDAGVVVGAMKEAAGPLDSYVSRDSALSMSSLTRFASFSTGWAPADGVRLDARLSLGRTQADGKLLMLSDGLSSSWALSGAVDCARLNLPCSGLSVSLSQPPRIEHVRLSAVLADTPPGYFDPLTYSRRSVTVAPDGREIDLGLGLTRSIRAGVLRLDAAGLFNEGNRRHSAVGYGATASLRRSF